MVRTARLWGGKIKHAMCRMRVHAMGHANKHTFLWINIVLSVHFVVYHKHSRDSLDSGSFRVAQLYSESVSKFGQTSLASGKAQTVDKTFKVILALLGLRLSAYPQIQRDK